MDRALSIFPGDDDETNERNINHIEKTSVDHGHYEDKLLDLSDEEPNMIKIKNDINKIINERYSSYISINDDEISNILKDSFISNEEMQIKDFVLRLLVLEKLFQTSVKECNSLKNIIKRLENHIETIRKNMIVLTKKVDFQTGRSTTL
ncbi:IMV surface protein [Goatpox virus]|uniref:IMV surface protein n=1 Tax=Goatpox virus TaxID=186805 RepID=A0A5C0PTA5_9POXV|nr:IMV surface protein [Goatpox virus]